MREQLQRGQQAVFKARPDYYLGKPAMDTVIFREVPTSATRASLLQGGAVDMPAKQTGSAMTYQINGKQYIVLAVSDNDGAELIAYALP